MTMKQLFRHTTSLLRTALLFGAIAFVNIPQTLAQTADQLAEMPNAFETIDDPNTVIGNGQYYYIQFYRDNKISYLTDCGKDKKATTADFLPSNNRLWTFESAGDGKFKLKSKTGHYIGYKNFESASGPRYGSLGEEEAGNAVIFEFQNHNTYGYSILDTQHDDINNRGRGLLGRYDNSEWNPELSILENNNTGKMNSQMHIAKLKSNAAFIIYYRGEGIDNATPGVETTRHYLTYSGINVVDNGSLEGNDNSCFFSPNSSTQSTITDGDGKYSRGIRVQSSGNEDYDWRTQFIIKAKNIIHIGEKVHLEFDYRADQDVTGVATQAQAAPGEYNHYDAIGSLNFTNGWQHFSLEFTVTDDMGNNGDQGRYDTFQSIAFNLGQKANTHFYFDNIFFTVIDDEVSTRQSIIPKDKALSSLPTLAAYHQDGLWTLEETGVDGEFYIKRYGTEQYLNPVKIEGTPDPALFYSVLGSKDYTYGRYILESPENSRYTRVKNNTTAWGYTRYLSRSEGDGWPVMQLNDANTNPNFMYAGFYPVEVPVPNKDEFYQVFVRIPVIQGNPMLNYNGGATPYTEGTTTKELWQLEQVDDYLHFRLKRPDTGEYLSAVDKMTQPNDPNGELPTDIGGGNVEYRKAEVNKNEKFYTDFSLTWYFMDPATLAQKEISVNHYVRHRESYLRTYADDQVITDQQGLKKQGLARDIDSDWRNLTNDLDGMTQKTNHFEITHYIKKGNTKVIEFPTVLNRNNDHIFFQRFYNYDEVDEHMDLDNLKAHVSLDTRDDGDVQYFLYKNGMVTGQKLKWQKYENGAYTDIPDGGMARNEQRRFNYTNSNGQSFTVGVDVSRYSDLKYLNQPDHLADDLQEPSLTMRYLFMMKDAKEIAKSLTSCLESGDQWLEAPKTIHFGRTQVPYTKFKKVGYRGEFLGIRHIFSDYWVYDDPKYIKRDESGKVVTDGNGNIVIDKKYINDNFLHKASENDITDEELNAFLDDHLVSAVNDNNSGKIEVEIIPGNTGIRKGGYNPNIDLNSEGENEGNDADYQGFYFYDKLSPNPKTEYGNSRFVVFRYPASGMIADGCYGPNNPAYVNVYLKNGENRYKIAQFILYFDANMATRPWTEIKNGTTYANGVNKVKNTDRDPKNLRNKAGLPIAKITFDFPEKMKLSGGEVDATYHYPSVYDNNSTDGVTKHNGGNNNPGGTIQYIDEVNNIAEFSSPVPLTFDHTNYAFDGDGCNWGSYAIVTGKKTTWGNDRIIEPADDDTYGYGIDADPGMQKAFLYIDASEQPGDICAVDFEGEFCANDQLMCTGWISGSNRIQGDTRCPGSITLTVKGEDKDGNTNTIYRFCPGQIYELDNGYGDDGEGNAANENKGVDGNTDATHVVWQQFYFEFSTDQKYERYWLEVNNNCVSSNGGDFMLDNVEVYTIVPEVEPDINTPLCVSRDGDNINYDMRFLKLNVDYNKLLSSRIKNETAQTATQTPYLGFVFLEKETFLKTLRQGLGQTSVSLEEMAERVESGYYDNIDVEDDPYQNAFNAALLRSKINNTTIWKSTAPTTNMGAGVMYFQWNKTFNENPEYSFDKAVNRNGAVFRYIDINDPQDANDDVNYLIFNGNYPQLPWKTSTDYYIVPSNTVIEDFASVYDAFNICSYCSKASTFQIEPPYEVLGLESSESSEDHLVCEGQIPTIALNLKGYDLKGKPVKMTDLNYDWWLGKKGYKNSSNQEIPPVLATLENYHLQEKYGVKLDVALSTFRSYYPYLTSLDGVITKEGSKPFTQEMIDYLKDLVATGELVLHQSSVSVPAESASNDDPYFYVVACPIHDEAFNQALNPQDGQYVAYFCDEPQSLRIKVGLKAPTLKSGFVPGEHDYASYDYQFPVGTDPVLSIRLAKKEQFETVKNTQGEADGGAVSTTVNYLWLPIRNAKTQGADYVVTKDKDATTKDDNIYLASTNDPTWDKKIYNEMKEHGLLPIVGRIVQLKAINIKDNSPQAAEGATVNEDQQDTYNRLCIYFTENFDVREGYNYTLSLPFQEDVKSNSCNGTILINLKIVPDYEVWTGAAGNTDWNNDENWRRADGNTTDNSGVNGDELYVKNGASTDDDSPLHGYITNYANYRSSKDRIFRKGFAPLYCTHILMKSDEWGNAPKLYDAIDGHDVITGTGSRLINSPFPNLRDADGWYDTELQTYDTKATATAILKFDMQARRYDMWQDTYGTAADRGSADRPKDLIAEMYQINSCDEIAMQAGTELKNAHLLNYNSAWMEFELETKRWYLLGSPLQGTISGEWYAPTATDEMDNVPQQKTTYFDDVKFGPGYDRYSPAIYQRSWDKAKAVLYEVGAAYAKTDDAQTNDDDLANQGSWGDTWQAPTGGVDDYLDRLGYKPFGEKKANVAIKGIWSNTYNDAQVDYGTGGFSVMVMNHLKGSDADVKAIVRLPKEDKMYDYYKFSEDGSDDGGTDTNISEVQTKDRADNTKRATNRGRLKTDLLLPTQDGIQKLEKLQTDPNKYRYGDRRTLTRIPIKEADLNSMNGETFSFTEKVAAGATNLGYYLVENPFPCGLDMTKFFDNTNNKSVLNAKYWILTKGDGQNPRQQLVQQAEGEWVTSDGTPGKWVPSGEEPIEYLNPKGGDNLMFYPNSVVAPGQGFFVQAKTASTEGITVTFTNEMQTQSRFGVIDGNGRKFTYVIGQSQKTKKMYDSGEDGIPDTDVPNPDNYEEGDIIMVDHDNNPETPKVPKTVVIVPVYQTDDEGHYVYDDNNNKIPVLQDITETVTLYNYKQEELTLADLSTVDKEYPLKARTRGEEANLLGLVITAERDKYQSSALVMQREQASNDFLPSEDTETFITSDLEHVPTVYTLCGRLATTINSIHDFRSLPIGVESNSDAPCTLTFKGVEMLGDSIAFYDALEQKLTPLKSGMTVSVSGQTQNRYYLVRSLIKEEAAAETHLQIFTEGLTAKVIASTAEPITSVRCYDTAGRLIHSASPQTSEYSFSLPIAGVYIINAETENDRKTIKLMAK